MPRRTTRTRYRKLYLSGTLNLGRAVGDFTRSLIVPPGNTLYHVKGLWAKMTIVSNEASTNPNNWIAGAWGFLRVPTSIDTSEAARDFDNDDARFLASKPFVSTPARPAYEEIYLKAINLTAEDELFLRVNIQTTSADTHTMVYAVKWVFDQELW